MLDNGAALNASNQPSRTNNWVEINDESRGGHTTGSDIKLKTTILRTSLRDYADAYILVKERTTIIGAEYDVAARRADERNKCII